MATIDFLGLDPSAPQVPQPKPVAKVSASSSSSSTSTKSASAVASLPSASSSSSPTPSPSPPPPPPASGPGSIAKSPHGVSYTVPFSVPPAAQFIRKRWIEQQLQLRSNEFTEAKELLLYVGSWNVNGKAPRHENDLGPWLLHRVKCKGATAAAAEEEDDDDDDDDEEAAPSKEKRFKSPDIYVVGFQEIVDLNASNLLVDHSASEPWEDFILETIQRTGKQYVKVTSVHLVGLSLAIFVKEKHKDAVKEVKVDEVGVGIMGVGGNKGAVLVKLKLYQTTFCFINSHLAAHQGAVKARNADFWSIVRRANFEGPKKSRVKTRDGLWIDPEEHRRKLNASSNQNQIMGVNVDNLAASASSFFDSVVSKSKIIMDNVQAKKAGGGSSSFSAAAAYSEGSEEQSEEHQSIEDFDAIRRNPHGIFHGTNHVVWLGDNNYRLNVVELGMSATHSLIEQNDINTLLKYDQLLAEKHRKKTFIGFLEPKIEFKPTYKFITGTSEYDNRPDKKVRFPAYTDRIQYLTTRPSNQKLAPSMAALSMHAHEIVLNNLHPLYYTSTWKLQASDHKPVMLLFEAPIVYEREKSKKKILADFDLLSDEECIPKLLLSTHSLDFETVPFGFAVTRSFTVKNVGDAVVSYRIMHKSSAGAVVPSAAGTVAKASEHAAALTKPWMRIYPTSGVLAREQTQTVHVTIHVTSKNGAAQLLNSDAESLDGELLFRLDGGYLYKIGIDADYEKSICGADLSYLNALPCKNIRKADPADVVENDQSYSVPQFLFKLIDYMDQKKGMLKSKQNAFIAPAFQDEEDLSDDEEEETTSSKSHKKQPQTKEEAPLLCTKEMRWIFEYLDTGRSLDKEPKTSKWTSPAAPAPTVSPSEFPAAAFFHTLLYWLQSLPQPLLVASSSQRWHTGLDAVHSQNRTNLADNLTAWCYQTLLETEVERYRTLVYIITFFRDVVANAKANGCDVNLLSGLLGSALCHRSSQQALSPLMPITPANIMLHLLTSPDFAKLPADNAEHQAAARAR